MAVKTTGAEWKRYYADDQAWPEGAWHEDEEVLINGVFDEDLDLSAIEDDAIVVVKGGVILDAGCKESMSLESHFKKWRKAQSTETLVVEVDKSKFDEIVAVITAAGGKVKNR